MWITAIILSPALPSQELTGGLEAEELHCGPHSLAKVPLACATSEPEGEAGSLAAGDAGRLPLSGTSKARSLRDTSRGFFFFSASWSRGSEPTWPSVRVSTPVRKSTISS